MRDLHRVVDFDTGSLDLTPGAMVCGAENVGYYTGNLSNATCPVCKRLTVAYQLRGMLEAVILQRQEVAAPESVRWHLWRVGKILNLDLAPAEGPEVRVDTEARYTDAQRIYEARLAAIRKKPV